MLLCMQEIIKLIKEIILSKGEKLWKEKFKNIKD